MNSTQKPDTNASRVVRKDFIDYLTSIPVLIKWLIVGAAIGLIVGAISSVFGRTLIYANAFRESHSWIIVLLPVGGLAIVAIYHLCKSKNDKGTNIIVASIQNSTDIPFKMAPLIFISTVITHMCGGSSGREGAAIQLGGSIANKIGALLRMDENDHRTIVMCGMSAGFSALFGTPMAAAIFSLEVVSVGIMHYSALVPCVTASMIAHFVAGFFKIPPETFPVTNVPPITPYSLLQIAVFSAVVGVLSILFCIILHRTKEIYEELFPNPYIRIFAAGVLIILLAVGLDMRQYLGSGMNIIEQIFHDGYVSEWYTFILKMIFTALTLGAGFKGGEIVPSLCIGAAFGCICAGPLDLPTTLVAACGMVGVFCGVTNCPITSLLIAFELFGFEAMPYYLVTIAVSYMLSGYESLYHKQQILYSKTQTNYDIREDE